MILQVADWRVLLGPCRQKQLVAALEDRQLLLPGGTWADLAARLRGAVLDELAARVSLVFISTCLKYLSQCVSD